MRRQRPSSTAGRLIATWQRTCWRCRPALCVPAGNLSRAADNALRGPGRDRRMPVDRDTRILRLTAPTAPTAPRSQGSALSARSSVLPSSEMDPPHHVGPRLRRPHRIPRRPHGRHGAGRPAGRIRPRVPRRRRHRPPRRKPTHRQRDLAFRDITCGMVTAACFHTPITVPREHVLRCAAQAVAAAGHRNRRGRRPKWST